jgi:cell division protein FtsB
MRGQPRKEVYVVAVGVLIGLAILAVLARGIWAQVAQLQLIQAAQDELQPLIELEEERQDQLLQYKARVLSPEYVEEWARVYGGLVFPGEVRLEVSLVQDDATTTSDVPSEP